MITAKLKVRDVVTREEWVETYREADAQNTFRHGDDVKAWATKTIEKFNDTLKTGEHARELLDVEIIDDGASVKGAHVWEKKNLVTVVERGRMFDVLRCKFCGVTGKRYGLTNIRRDSDFRAKKYGHCTGVPVQRPSRDKDD